MNTFNQIEPEPERKRHRRPVMFLVMLVGGLAFVFGLGFVVQLLWNALLPPLFAVHALSYWQAIGVFILARLLFGGFGARGPRGPRGPHFGRRPDPRKWHEYEQWWQQEAQRRYANSAPKPAEQA